MVFNVNFPYILIVKIVKHTAHWKKSTAAAAKSLQSCPTLCDPIDSSPRGSPRPWDSPGKNTGVGCHFLLQCIKVKSESEVAQSCPTLSNPMDCSLPGSSIHGILQARVLEWGCHHLLRLKATAVAKEWDFAHYLRPGLHVPLLEPGWSQNLQIHMAYWRCPHLNKIRMETKRRRLISFSPSLHPKYCGHFQLHPTSPADISEEPFISVNDLWHWFPVFVKFSIILLVNSLPTVAVLFLHC